MILLRPSLDNFVFGNCAIIAIGQLFDSRQKWIELMARLCGIKEPEDGLTFFECKKVINKIGELFGNQQYEYVTNSTGLTYKQIVWVYDRGIVMFDEHLSFFKDKEVFDSYMRPHEMYNKPTGFWIRKN